VRVCAYAAAFLGEKMESNKIITFPQLPNNSFNFARLDQVRGVAKHAPPKCVEKPWTFADPLPRSPKSVRVKGKYSDNLDISTLCDEIAERLRDDEREKFRQCALPHLRAHASSVDKIERDRAISRFMRCCEDFIDVDLIRIAQRTSECPNCGGEMDRLDAVESRALAHVADGTASNSGLIHCAGCKVQMVDTSPITNYGVSSNRLGGVFMSNAGSGDGAEGFDRAVVSDHSSYDDRDTFMRAWLAYHGRHNPKLPEDLFRRLDEYFTSIGMLTGEEYRAMPLCENRYGELVKKGTSVERLGNALKALKLPLYIDQFYIRHVYWGWPLPDATPFQERVFQNYDRTQRVYALIKGPRGSSLNAQYRLYQELRAAGHACDPHTFDLVTTEKIRETHEHIRKQMCELASRDGGVPIPFFPI